MANIKQIRALNNQYRKNSPISNIDQPGILNEAFDPDRLEKAFNNSIADLGPTYLRYFEFGLPAEVVLLFIDVCSFSTRFANYNGEQISEYFNRYYDLVIPKIYEFDGEVDKIIGDGIIAIFGPPFSDVSLNENLINANKCARAILKSTLNTDFESKIAMHTGVINYFKNKSEQYNEYTMIGKPLTELFRLESISEDKCINYYNSTAVSCYYEECQRSAQNNNQRGILSSYIPWKLSKKAIINLKGVTYDQLCSIKYKPEI